MLKVLRVMGRRLWKDRRGFTLIELLVVIAVIGVLATLAVPRVVGVIDYAKANRGKADVKVIAVALERYYMANGYFPGTLKTLKDDGYLKGDFDLKNSYGKVYFYAIPVGNSPQEYVLGDPGMTPGTRPVRGSETPPGNSGAPPAGDDNDGTAYTWGESGSGADFNAEPSGYDGVVTE